MAPKKKADNRPPIFLAIDKGDEDAVQELLKADPECLDIRNKDGWTPLITAAYCGEAEIVELLVGAGADVKAFCRDGDTALHYASAQGHPDIIQFLVKKGAKLTVKDKDGETPYDVAGKNLKVRKLIQSLMDANLDDDSDADKEEGAEEEEEEWEEAEGEEVKEAVAGKK